MTGELVLQLIAAFGGLGALASLIKARAESKVALSSSSVDADAKKAAAHIEAGRLALDQQKELNDDERKFRESMITVIEFQQGRIGELMTEIGGLVRTQIERDRDYRALQDDNVKTRSDYETLLGRLDRQAERIQQITTIQAQAEYWERQASSMVLELETKKKELQAAEIHLESAKAEAAQWRDQFQEMSQKVDHLTAEVDHLRSQIADQDRLISELQNRQPGGQP